MKQKILVADDEESIRWVLGERLEKAGYRVEYASDGTEALEKVLSERFSLVLLDIKMPGLSGLEVLKESRSKGVKTPVIVITAQTTVKNAIEAMKLGAYDYVAKPFDVNEVRLIVERAIEGYSNSKALRAKSHEKYEPHRGIVGSSPPMQRLYKIIGRVAEKDLTVLITGESGTGKELVARVIHFHSRRAEKPFVAVNIAAIPKDLLESELFGYERGAFTGAQSKKIGRFEEAHGGTLLLDEIGDIPSDLQTKLLRVLEEKQFYRLGGEKPQEVDVRVIMSTNKNLDEEVSGGNFREDLYYRISSITIDLPPLRERKEDIPSLARHFREKYEIELGTEEKVISEEALETLKRYNWPGNVRELENTIKRVLVFSSDPVITSQTLVESASYLGQERRKEDLLEKLIRERALSLIELQDNSQDKGIYELLIKDVEKFLIEAVLERTRGNKKRAARILGINRNTLSKRIEELGISRYKEG